MTLVVPKGLVLVTVVSSLSTELAPAGRESGQDCEGAYGHAPIRSLLIPLMGLVGRLENESTDHIQGIAPVPFMVRPEPRRPGWDYRSPIVADNLQPHAATEILGDARLPLQWAQFRRQSDCGGCPAGSVSSVGLRSCYVRAFQRSSPGAAVGASGSGSASAVGWRTRTR